jgi:O-antigen/teichoic acid export membrane protein
MSAPPPSEAVIANTRHQILRSSAIIGGASVANIGFGLLRMKAAALLLGPAGIGLIGLLQNVMAIAAALAGLGVASSATRLIAAERTARGSEGEMHARRALFFVTGGLALIGSIGLWVLRRPVAGFILHDRALASQIGWLSFGVGLTIIAGSQVALLAGLRRVADVAWASLIAGALSAVIAIGAIGLWGSGAIVIFVLAVPLAGSIAGAAIVLKSRSPKSPKSPPRGLLASARQMIGLGSAFMVTMLIGTAAQLAVRSVISDHEGLAALGQFQAAWLISTTYTGLVLQAMSTDYFPRLTESIAAGDSPSDIVSQQLEVALLLAAPILLLIIGVAPLVLELLYSSSFREAAEILRWQALGDILKVASWPLGFIFLASGRGTLFVTVEATGWAVFIAATWLLLPQAGIEAPGIAFLLMYAAYFPLVLAGSRRMTGFRLGRECGTPLLLLIVAGLLVFLSARFSEWAAAAAGTCSAGAFAWYAFRKLRPHLSF